MRDLRRLFARKKGSDSTDVSSTTGEQGGPPETAPHLGDVASEARLPSLQARPRKPRLHRPPPKKLIRPPRPSPPACQRAWTSKSDGVAHDGPAYGRARPRISARAHKGPSFDLFPTSNKEPECLYLTRPEEACSLEPGHDWRTGKSTCAAQWPRDAVHFPKRSPWHLGIVHGRLMRIEKGIMLRRRGGSWHLETDQFPVQDIRMIRTAANRSAEELVHRCVCVGPGSVGRRLWWGSLVFRCPSSNGRGRSVSVEPLFLDKREAGAQFLRWKKEWPR